MDMNVSIEEMRGQIRLLKEKADREQLVNERLMRKIMSDKMRAVCKDKLVVMLMAVVGIPYCYWAFTYLVSTSPAFVCVTEFFLVIAVIYAFYSQKGVKAKDMLDGNLIDVNRRIVRMKILNARWMWFAIPFVIFWFVWFMAETWGNEARVGVFFVGGICGFVAGTLIGIRFYMKRRRMLNDVLKQIDELTKTDSL